MSDILATYQIESDDVQGALDALTIGQSVGNPSVRNPYETEQLWDTHIAVVEDTQPLNGGVTATIRFPGANFSPQDGWAFLLSVLMGGQMDINVIQSCRLVGLDLPGGWGQGPAFGISGIRKLVSVYNRPLIGGIVKPKQGLTPDQLADMCWQMADGGVDFIKEDEVLGWASSYCDLATRVEVVMKALRGYPTLYAPCVTADPANLAYKIRVALASGATALHINWWSGLGAYKLARQMGNVPLFFQKSGDRIITSGRFSISFDVLCYMARVAGVDFIHAGMLGGYLDEDVGAMIRRLNILWQVNEYLPVMPSLSCGAHPGLVDSLREKLGSDIMVSAGGSIHGHPRGTRAGARAFRQAATRNHGAEYQMAVVKWGVG